MTDEYSRILKEPESIFPKGFLYSTIDGITWTKGTQFDIKDVCGPRGLKIKPWPKQWAEGESSWPFDSTTCCGCRSNMYCPWQSVESRGHNTPHWSYDISPTNDAAPRDGVLRSCIKLQDAGSGIMIATQANLPSEVTLKNTLHPLAVGRYSLFEGRPSFEEGCDFDAGCNQDRYSHCPRGWSFVSPEGRGEARQIRHWFPNCCRWAGCPFLVRPAEREGKTGVIVVIPNNNTCYLVVVLRSGILDQVLKVCM